MSVFQPCRVARVADIVKSPSDFEGGFVRVVGRCFVLAYDFMISLPLCGLILLLRQRCSPSYAAALDTIQPPLDVRRIVTLNPAAGTCGLHHQGATLTVSTALLDAVAVGLREGSMLQLFGEIVGTPPVRCH
jgi:hypothetical protein